MQISRVVISQRTATAASTPDFDICRLPEEDQVRAGFEKGTLREAIFVLESGGLIIYKKKG